MRGGHDPSVALRYYTGAVPDADRALAQALSELLSMPTTRVDPGDSHDHLGG
jgi:hypothetical protein